MIKHQKMISRCCDRWAVHFVMPPAALSSYYQHWSSSRLLEGTLHLSLLTSALIWNCVGEKSQTAAAAARSSALNKRLAMRCDVRKLVCGLFCWGGTRHTQKKGTTGRWHLWFQVLYLLQELVVLFHQLIVALRLGLLELHTETQEGLKKAFCDCRGIEPQPHRVCAEKQKVSLYLTAVFLLCSKTPPKISVDPDSPSCAHPFYVLDNFIDVGLIDLNLLPENKQTDGCSLDKIEKKRKIFSFHAHEEEGGEEGVISRRLSGHLTPPPDVSLWSSLGWSSLFSFDPSAASTLFSPCSSSRKKVI